MGMRWRHYTLDRSKPVQELSSSKSFGSSLKSCQDNLLIILILPSKDKHHKRLVQGRNDAMRALGLNRDLLILVAVKASPGNTLPTDVASLRKILWRILLQLASAIRLVVKYSSLEQIAQNSMPSAAAVRACFVQSQFMFKKLGCVCYALYVSQKNFCFFILLCYLMIVV